MDELKKSGNEEANVEFEPLSETNNGNNAKTDNIDTEDDIEFQPMKSSGLQEIAFYVLLIIGVLSIVSMLGLPVLLVSIVIIVLIAGALLDGNKSKNTSQKTSENRIYQTKTVVSTKTTYKPLAEMTGEQYERYITKWLDTKGFYDIRLTAATGDYGVDITARNGNIKYAIQCKYYSKPVGVSAVQQVAAGVAHYNCNRGMVITNNAFTQNAYRLADENGIILCERVIPQANARKTAH